MQDCWLYARARRATVVFHRRDRLQSAYSAARLRLLAARRSSESCCRRRFGGARRQPLGHHCDWRGRQRRLLAHRTLVGRGRGTRRTDFCEFLRSSVAPAMLAAAARASLPRTAPLYLMMDNASIHKGVQVTQALRDGARHHCRRLRRRRSSIQLRLSL